MKLVALTKFERSAKLYLSHVSTLPRRHSSLISPFAKMETVKTMVLSQSSLADPCMCALCSVLVIGVNWITARMSSKLVTPPRH